MEFVQSNITHTLTSLRGGNTDELSHSYINRRRSCASFETPNRRSSTCEVDSSQSLVADKDGHDILSNRFLSADNHALESRLSSSALSINTFSSRKESDSCLPDILSSTTDPLDIMIPEE